MQHQFSDKVNRSHLERMRLRDQWQTLIDLQSVLRSEIDPLVIRNMYPSLLDRAEKYATRMHRYAGQTYDGKPYTHHLKAVVENVKSYMPHEWKQRGNDKRALVAAAWCHDVLRKCDADLRDLETVVGRTVADLVCAQTDGEAGLKRDRLASSAKAVFLKCCDRLTETAYHSNADRQTYVTYQKEYAAFRKTYGEDTGHIKIFPRVWAALDSINRHHDTSAVDLGSRTHDGRVRLAEFVPEVIYRMLQEGVTEATVGDLVARTGRVFHERFDPQRVVDVQRLRLYSEKGSTCVVTGLEGAYVALEQDSGGRYHLDLYAYAPDDLGDVMITIDHITPRSRGGSDELHNLQPMAKGLNERKGDTVTDESVRETEVRNVTHS